MQAVVVVEWAITLGTVFGIAVRLHLTFLIFLAWIAIGSLVAGGPAAALQSIAFLVAVFASVLIHEFGHALMARRFGVRTPDITLLPIGGVARLERIPEKPYQELLVAIAGPATNIVIALGLLVYLAATGQIDAVRSMGIMGGGLAGRVLWINLWLVIFNMIPAFPMDGGRVLRALLAERMDYGRATKIAATVGQGFAVLFALVGLYFNPILIFIALFIYLGASGEASQSSLRMFARSIPIRSVMVTRFRPLASDAPLSEAVRALLEGAQTEFPVVGVSGEVQGILCREDIIRALSTDGAEVPVSKAMHADVPTVRMDEMLDGAFQRMLQARCPALPVVDGDGALVGLLTKENVVELMMVRDALEKSKA